MLNFYSVNTQKYTIDSKNYYKFNFLKINVACNIFNKIKELLLKGTNILIFISSEHIRRFIEEPSFAKLLNSKNLSKSDFEGKSNYETHRVVTEYFKRQFKDKYIAHFSLIQRSYKYQ